MEMQYAIPLQFLTFFFDAGPGSLPTFSTSPAVAVLLGPFAFDGVTGCAPAVLPCCFATLALGVPAFATFAADSEEALLAACVFVDFCRASCSMLIGMPLTFMEILVRLLLSSDTSSFLRFFIVGEAAALPFADVDTALDLTHRLRLPHSRCVFLLHRGYGGRDVGRDGQLPLIEHLLKTHLGRVFLLGALEAIVDKLRLGPVRDLIFGRFAIG